MAGDLHCHSKMSDGSLGLEELILLARRRGLETISVTDHDTFAGVTRAKILGDRFGINVIPGIEFSTYDYKRENKVHILCYLCDKPDRLEGICRRTNESRKKAAQDMIRKVMRYYPISPEMVLRCANGGMNIYKQHIMHALMDAGYSLSIFGNIFDTLFAWKTGLARIDTEYPDVLEVLRTVNDAGGIAVLAHPPEYNSFDAIGELIENGLSGLEVWHPRNSEEDTDRLMKIARENKLVMTGGSDFHGMYGSEVTPLGSTTMPNESVAALIAYKNKLNKVRLNKTS